MEPKDNDITEDQVIDPIDDTAVIPSNELCKQLLGKDYEEKPEDVLLQMGQDRRDLSKKYGIPLSEEFKDKKEWAQRLIDVASENEIPMSFVEITKLHDKGLDAGLTDEGKIVTPKIDLTKCTSLEAYNWSVKFGHELTHALQRKRFPELSIEWQEYEAYVLTYLPTCVFNNSEDYPQKGYLQQYMIVSEMFDLIKGSCLGFYEKMGIDQSKIPWMKK